MRPATVLTLILTQSCFVTGDDVAETVEPQIPSPVKATEPEPSPRENLFQAAVTREGHFSTAASREGKLINPFPAAVSRDSSSSQFIEDLRTEDVSPLPFEHNNQVK